MALVLASESPRRRELMHLITPHFTACAASIDEEAATAPTPKELAQTLAKAKAEAVFKENGTVIGCDTVVALDGQVLGKPGSKAEAIDMLCCLSGQRHEVHTGVCVRHVGGSVCFTETTAVFFRFIPKKEILAVCQTAEPYDKAGGYGIQGWAARFIPRIEGCYYNVMGLPVPALWQALQENGLLE